MKKLIFSLFILVGFCACEKDDDAAINYDIKDFTVTGGGNETTYTINVQVITDSPYEAMQVQLDHSSGNFPGGNNRIFDLKPTSSGFGNQFAYHADFGLPNGNLTVRLGVKEKGGNFKYYDERNLLIDWEPFIPIEGFEESVHIVPTVTQTNAPNSDFEGYIEFNQNSMNEGILEYQVYYQSSPVGNSRIATLLGDAGSFSLNGIGILQEGFTYQVVIKNIDPVNPMYRFLDENGETIMNNSGNPVSSITLNFTVAGMISANMTNHSFVNITQTSFGTTGTIEKNFTDERTVHARVYDNSGNYITGDVFQTSFGTTTDEFSLVFSGLNSNTEYLVKYFLDNQVDPFFESSQTTAGSGAFAASLGVIDNVTPNGGRVQIVYTNTTGGTISGAITFSSNNHTESFPITFETGINHIVYQETGGHKQNTSVLLNLTVNGQTIDDGNFTTDLITYSDFQNLNGNGNSGNTVLQANSTANISVARLTSNGTGVAESFTFIFEGVGIHPADYLNTIGFGGYENIPVSNQSYWTNLGNDRYAVTINIPKEIVMNINSFIIVVTTKDYTDPAEFQFQTVITDEIGTEIGEGAETLTVEMD